MNHQNTLDLMDKRAFQMPGNLHIKVTKNSKLLLHPTPTSMVSNFCRQLLLTPLSWKFAFIGGKVAIGNDFHVAWQFFISRVPFYQEKKEWCFV